MTYVINRQPNNSFLFPYYTTKIIVKSGMVGCLKVALKSDKLFCGYVLPCPSLSVVIMCVHENRKNYLIDYLLFNCDI